MFNFKQFSIINEGAALKVGTDAVLLGAAMTLRDSDSSLLDIGTGTGVIALMAAQRLAGKGVEHASITGIDIDEGAVTEARLNFDASPWNDMLCAVLQPLQTFVPADGGFDCIFSNPPYYDNSLPNPDGRKNAARHEKSLSFTDIAAFSAGNLNAAGRLSVILPADREAVTKRIAASFGLFPFRVVAVRTTAGKTVSRYIIEFSRCKTACTAEALTLQEKGRRTEEYSSLTKDFYL